MKQLFLMRHGKSSWADPELADHDRPLRNKGKRRTRKVAAFLRECQLLPERIISSTAVRARETAEILLPIFDLSADCMETRPELYTVAGKAVRFAFGEAPCDAGLAMFKFGDFKPASICHAAPNEHWPVILGLDDRWERVLLVGHDPEISSFARLFFEREPPWDHLPTSACVVVQSAVKRWVDFSPERAFLLRSVLPNELT